MDKHHLHKTGYLFFLNLAVISLLLLILSQLDTIILWKFLSETLLFSALVVFIGASILFKFKLNDQRHIHSKSLSSFFHISPYFFLAVLIILAINQFAKLEVITLRNFHLTIIGIFFGFFAFYSNRDRIEHELEDEKQKEEEEEKERGEEFEYRFPRINSIWGLRSVVRWMYKEGWAYSFWFWIITLTGFIFKLFLAGKMLFHIDESYTYLVTEGLLKYGYLGKTITGIAYLRTPIYNILNSIPYFFFSNDLLKLRFLPILISTAFLFIFYFMVKKWFGKKIASVSLFLVSISWYLQATFVTARSYILMVIFSFISIYFMFSTYDAAEKSKRTTLLLSLTLLSLLLLFFEGQSLGFYHLVFFVCLFFAYLIFKLPKDSKRNVLIFLVAFIFAISLYFITIGPSLLRYILFRVYSPGWRNEMVSLVFSFFSYFENLGMIILLVVLTCSFLIKNFKIRLLCFFSIFVFLIQGYFFGRVSIDIRHFSDILIPLYIVFSFFVVGLFKIKGMLRFFSVVFFISITVVSLIGLYGLLIGKVAWAPYYPDSWQEDINKIPDGQIILTDYSNVVYFFRSSSQIYTLNCKLEDSSIKDKNLSTSDPLETYNEKEKSYFRDYIEKNIEQFYILNEVQQQFDKYTGSPKIMNLDHLKKVITSSQNKTVYMITTHNFYDPSYMGQCLEVYDYLINTQNIIKEERTTNNFFNNKPHPYSYNRRLTVSVVSLNP